MSKKFKIALTSMVTVAAMASTAAHADTENATAQAQVIAAVQLAENDPLTFGVILSSANGGSVTISTTANMAVCTSGISCVAETTQRGRFTVSNAESGYTVDITVPSTVTLNSGNDQMTAELESSMASFTSAGADQVFYVGDVLTVGSNQPAGYYNGTYEVSAEYQ